jgi:hypothetical protein
MEIISLVLMTFCCFLGLYLSDKYGAKLTFKKINFVTWYFGVEFILTAVLATFNINYFYILKDIVFEYIPRGSVPELQIIWTLSWCAVAIPCGFILANIILNKFKLKSNYDDFIESTLVPEDNSLFEWFWGLIIVLFSGYLIWKIGFIPQVEFFGADLESIAYFRGKMTHEFPASIYLKELIGMRITPILSYYFFAMALTKKNKSSCVKFLLFALLSTFFMTINLNKSGIPFYFIGLMVTYGVVSIKVEGKKILAFGVILFVVLFGGYALTRKTMNIKDIATNIYTRVVYSQASANYLSLYVFPLIHPHIGGASISKIGKFFGYEYSERSSRILMKEIDPELVKTGKAGFQVSTFFSEAWANWGIIGLLLSPIIVGLVIKLIIGLIISNPKTYLTSGLIGFISCSFNISSGFNHILFPRYLIIILVIFSVTKIFFSKLARKYSGN